MLLSIVVETRGWLNVVEMFSSMMFRKSISCCHGHVSMDMQRLYTDRLEAGLSPTTVDLLHNILHKALKQAMRWGLLTRNVTEAVDAPRRATPEYTTWNEHVSATFLAAADTDELAALWRLALLTGLRRGEMFGLKWEDVVTCSYDKSKRCGSRQYQANILETAVWHAVMDRLSDPILLVENPETVASEAERLSDQNRLASLNKQEEDVQRKYRKNKEALEAEALTIAEWQEVFRATHETLDRIAAERAAIEERVSARMTASISQEQIALLRAWLHMQRAMPATFRQQRRVLERLAVRVELYGEEVLVTGLLSHGSMQVDLEEAALHNKLQQQAWDDIMNDIESMRLEGRHEEAEEVLESIEQARANGTLMLSITPPPGAKVYDNTPALVEFMSQSLL